MSKNSLFSVLKPIVHCFCDANRNFRTIPLEPFADRDPDSESIVTLKLLIRLLFDTDIISYITKYYLSNKYITGPAVYDELKDKGPNPPKDKKAVSNRIYLDQNIVSEIISSEELYAIAYNKAPAGNVLIKLSKAMSIQNCDSEARQNLKLDIPTDVIYTDCDEFIFNDFLTRIAPYTVGYMENIRRGLPKAAIGYFNYLMYNPCLSEKDKERRDSIMSLLNASPEDYNELDID